jgi:DNA-binding NarL/FixJ family response regulator
MSGSEQVYNVAIADSQFLITESLSNIISTIPRFHLSGVAAFSYELNELLNQEKIDLLITDFSTFDYEGFDTIGNLVRNYPDMSILIIANQVLRHDFNELTKAGIRNIICKTTDREELLIAMDAAIRKKKYYAEEILELLMDEGARKSKADEHIHLTITETEIVKLIAEGKTTKEIASAKNISFHTVMTHRKNIFRKIKVNSSSELIMFAIKAGWIDNIEYYI